MIEINTFIYRDKFTPEILTQEEFDRRVKSYCNELMRSREDFFAWLWDTHHDAEGEFYFWLRSGKRFRYKVFKRRREWRVGCYEWARTALLAREYDVEEVE